MSFLNRVGNLLKQNVCKRISSVSSASSPSLSQAVTVRCMSSSAVTKLFVEGLASNIDAVSLREVFSQYGSVIEATVCMDDPGMDEGFGFVTYDTMEAASIAIHSLDGEIFQGLCIKVRFATEKPCGDVGGYVEGGGYGCGGSYSGGGSYGGGGSYDGGSSYGGHGGSSCSQGGDYGHGGNQGGGNQFSGGGGYGGYGDSVQGGGGGNYSSSKPIGLASLLKKDTSGRYWRDPGTIGW